MAIWLMLLLGGPVKTEHVESEIIARHVSVRPGTVAMVGLRLKLDPKWHVYWLNPGDSGDTVHIKWTLPEGVRAGAIQWPGPYRLMMPGEIMNHAYEGELLLPVPIAVPRGYKQPTLLIKATAEWLVCDDNMCIPGKVELDLTLPVMEEKPKPDARWKRLFAETTERLPRPAPKHKVAATSSGETITLRVDLGLADGAKVEFFPYEPGKLKHAAPQPAGRDGSATTIELTTEAALKRLQGVLVVDGRKTYGVDVVVKEEPAANYLWIGGAVVFLLVVAVLFVRLRKR